MRYLAIILSIGAVCGACSDIGSFSTGAGECYSGKIVDADYVRAGFDTGITLSLTLDTNALADGRGSAGLLWTSDGIFDVAMVRQMEQVAHDPISLFQFPGGRVRNYIVHVLASNGVPAIVVISLMENQEVEVRVMQPEISDQLPPDEEGVESEGLFGVFRLRIDTECAIPDVPDLPTTRKTSAPARI